ncbi:MAG: hypothetical protein IJU41_06485 [Clostridia bacterium]|nr:hypothetical protein [Clostridia bacterium]
MKWFHYKEKSKPRGEARQDLLGYLDAECRRRHAERRPLELAWMLAADFYAGHQYCDINPYSREISDYTPPFDFMERGVFNRIAPLVETRMANIRSLDLTQVVRPATGEIGDYEKSLVATRLVESLKAEGGFADKCENLLLWSEICGTAFLLSWWDGKAGDVVEADGKRLPLGKLEYGVLTPYEVLPESIYKENLGDQSSVILEQVVPVEEVDRRYGVRVKPCKAQVCTLSPKAGTGGFGYVGTTFGITETAAENSTLVRTFMEKPNALYPSGRMVIATPDRILWYGSLPMEDYPLAVMRCKRAPGLFFGRSVVEELIPLQRAYNGVKNKIHDAIRTLALNPLLVPEGSVADMDELSANGLAPGDILEYDPARGEPKAFEGGRLQSEIFTACDALAHEMEYVAGLSHLGATGNTAFSVTSASALDRLRAIDGVRLALTGDCLRRCVADTAGIWLRLCKIHGGVAHTAAVCPSDASARLSWSGEDLNSLTVEFVSENTLLYDEAARLSALKDGISLGLFCGEDGRIPRRVKKKLLARMHVGDFLRTLDEDERGEAAARRENRLLLCGETVEIGMCDDDELHLELHRSAALDYDYEKLRKASPASAAALEQHIAAHLARMEEQRERQRSADA